MKIIKVVKSLVVGIAWCSREEAKCIRVVRWCCDLLCENKTCCKLQQRSSVSTAVRPPGLVCVRPTTHDVATWWQPEWYE